MQNAFGKKCYTLDNQNWTEKKTHTLAQKLKKKYNIYPNVKLIDLW